MYKYQTRSWAEKDESNLIALMRQRAIEWRKESAINRIDTPIRLSKARSLGYKAKQGFVVIRVRLRRGGPRTKRPTSGRRQKRMGFKRRVSAKSMNRVAADRAANKFPNLKVLNSYWLWEDGKYKWFEVLLVDPNNPVIMSDPDVNRLIKKGNSDS
ncbi:MAG TPA: 50S ribosomal protein L15e [archaeon]|nr:50S ribosomal protein L15e [archaeon]